MLFLISVRMSSGFYFSCRMSDSNFQRRRTENELLVSEYRYILFRIHIYREDTT